MTKFSLSPAPIALTTLAFIALGVGVAISQETEVTPVPFTCSVDLNDTGRMVEITARLASDEAMTGSYSLEIGKSGNGGSSMIRQGGPFTLEAGDDLVLGKTMMNGNPEDFDIDFTLDWNGLLLRCPSININS